jgi:hypothetical protein
MKSLNQNRMKILKNLIKMPFTLLMGAIGVVICAHYEFSKYLWENKKCQQ